MGRKRLQNKKDIQVTSVSYVHDPEAATKWFEVYVEILKKQLIKSVANNGTRPPS